MSVYEMEKVIESLQNASEPTDLACGDTWVSIEYEGLPFGAFVQVESKELEGGEYSDNIYCLFGYKNLGLDDKDYMTADYSDTIFYFEVKKTTLLNNSFECNGCSRILRESEMSDVMEMAICNRCETEE